MVTPSRKQGRKSEADCGGGDRHIFPDTFFSGAPSASKVAQVKMCRGTQPTSRTFLTSIKIKINKNKGKKKTQAKQIHYIYQNSSYPKNVGGGGTFDIVSPT